LVATVGASDATEIGGDDSLGTVVVGGAVVAPRDDLMVVTGGFDRATEVDGSVTDVELSAGTVELAIDRTVVVVAVVVTPSPVLTTSVAGAELAPAGKPRSTASDSCLNAAYEHMAIATRHAPTDFPTFIARLPPEVCTRPVRRGERLRCVHPT
jgi:hypothetical protein